MTANYFESTVKYMKVNEDGREKKVAEKYLIDAMSYTETETRIIKEMEIIVKGDFYIPSIKKSTIKEVIESEDENDDKYYLAKVAIIDADEVSGREKSTTDNYLVAAANLDRALERLNESLNTFVVPVESISVADSKIIEVFHYIPNEEIPGNLKPLSDEK
ncbi:DUF4494 domain-containing protein [Odoribacter sp. OF09-27XD]|jgi:hypothetical protein|nr:DUF4494 domain-containing protein [Odoribacter sp. OF09-27XD]RHV96954.1 DUF4494 domain-containing protein [Odoribacter sp. OF09-27XD]